MFELKYSGMPFTFMQTVDKKKAKNCDALLQGVLRGQPRNFSYEGKKTFPISNQDFFRIHNQNISQHVAWNLQFWVS